LKPHFAAYGWKVPDGHNLQYFCATNGWYFPGLQGSGGVEIAGQENPAGQLEHSVNPALSWYKAIRGFPIMYKILTFFKI
jgi:hypothetical protein